MAIFGSEVPTAPDGTSIFLNNVQCLGTELALQDCVSDTTITADCSHANDAGVMCQP